MVPATEKWDGISRHIIRHLMGLTEKRPSTLGSRPQVNDDPPKPSASPQAEVLLGPASTFLSGMPNIKHPAFVAIITMTVVTVNVNEQELIQVTEHGAGTLP